MGHLSGRDNEGRKWVRTMQCNDLICPQPTPNQDVHMMAAYWIDETAYEEIRYHFLGPWWNVGEKV
jgi:hypothetical protein